MDSLLSSAGIDPDLDEAFDALAVFQSAAQLGCAFVLGDGFFNCAVSLLDLIAGMEPSAASDWCVARHALQMLTATGVRGACDRDSDALFEFVELADLVDTLGQGNRAAPFARDLVGRFYTTSVTQGSFFRDVRMTPAHFDELVTLTAPHLPASSRGPHSMPTAHRVFAVLFLLAQGGKQRVIARAVDVAESTFSKHCAPVIDAMLAGLPKPQWPGCAERQEIARDFARLTGGNTVGWKGLYDGAFFLRVRHCVSCVRQCVRRGGDHDSTGFPVRASACGGAGTTIQCRLIGKIDSSGQFEATATACLFPHS